MNMCPGKQQMPKPSGAHTFTIPFTQPTEKRTFNDVNTL